MRQWQLFFIELALIALATVFACVLRDNLEISATHLWALEPYLLLTLAIAIVVLPVLGTQRAVWQFSAIVDYLRILVATVTIVGGAVAFGFAFNRLDGVPRALPILQGLLMLSTLVGTRISWRLWRAIRERAVSAPAAKGDGDGCQAVLVIGLGRMTDLYLRAVAQLAPHRVRIAGLLGDRDSHVGRTVRGHSIVGTIERVAEVLRVLEIHGVFVNRIVVATAFENLSTHAQDALLEIEKAADIELEFLVEQMGLGPRSVATAAAAGAGTNAPESKVFHIGDDDLAALKQRPYWRIRRALDVAGALNLLMVLSPVILCVAILIAIDVGLPVIFWQQRPGLNGRPFKLYKFRTMAAAHKENGERTPDDQRTSDIGRFLRRTRLDELPQLFSILTGKMSFIGPRPLLPIDQPAAFSARLLVRPGLTGWAQVMGGRVVSPSDKAALDVWYVRHATLALDAKIVLHTFRMVLFGEMVDVIAIRRAWQDLREAGICASQKAGEEGIHPQGEKPSYERRERGSASRRLAELPESRDDRRVLGDLSTRQMPRSL